MSASGMIAFQALNLTTDFDFDNFYDDLTMAKIMESFHDLANDGINILDEKNNQEIFSRLNPIYNTPANDVNPIGILLVEVRKHIDQSHPAYGFIMGDSLLEPMKDFISDSIEFVSESVAEPLTDSLFKPLLLIGVPVGILLYLYKN